MSEQVDKDVTFENVVPEKVWLSFYNTKRQNYLTVVLDVNGNRKTIVEFYIPGLSLDEGITSQSHNLSLLFKKDWTV